MPDEIDVAHRHIDWLPLDNLPGNVMQDAVAHVDGVIQPVELSWRFELFGEILEHAFAPDAGLGIFAGRIGRHILARTAS